MDDRICQRRKLFKVINEGIYEEGDSVKLYGDLFSNKFWKPDSSILIDNRLVDFRNINYEVMSQSSTNLSASQEQIGNSKIAYLADSPLAYGSCRQFQTLMEG